MQENGVRQLSQILVAHISGGIQFQARVAPGGPLGVIGPVPVDVIELLYFRVSLQEAEELCVPPVPTGGSVLRADAETGLLSHHDRLLPCAGLREQAAQGSVLERSRLKDIDAEPVDVLVAGVVVEIGGDSIGDLQVPHGSYFQIGGAQGVGDADEGLLIGHRLVAVPGQPVELITDAEIDWRRQPLQPGHQVSDLCVVGAGGHLRLIVIRHVAHVQTDLRENEHARVGGYLRLDVVRPVGLEALQSDIVHVHRRLAAHGHNAPVVGEGNGILPGAMHQGSLRLQASSEIGARRVALGLDPTGDDQGADNDIRSSHQRLLLSALYGQVQDLRDIRTAHVEVNLIVAVWDIRHRDIELEQPNHSRR